MSKVLQLRRGTTAQNDSFTGAEGEVTVDTEKKLLRLHDGSTAGGKEIGAVQDISGKVNTSGSRGALAGYESTTTGTTVSATSADTLVASSAVTVSNGTAGTAWTKIVALSSAVTVTLGSSWKWQGGEAPTIVAKGLLVCCWCGSFGICTFVSPKED